MAQGSGYKSLDGNQRVEFEVGRGVDLPAKWAGFIEQECTVGALAMPEVGGPSDTPSPAHTTEPPT